MKRSRSRAISARPIPAALMRSAVGLFAPGVRRLTDTAWIDAALTSARPQAVGALLRYFRNLDTAEEAFQNASLRTEEAGRKTARRAIAAWLIVVGRNAAIDDIRRNRKQEPLPEDDQAISDTEDAEGSWPNGSTVHIIATTSCGCCSSAAIDLPATQQIALALRIVPGSR